MTHNTDGGPRRFLLPIAMLVLALGAGIWFGLSRFDLGAVATLPIEQLRAATPLPQPKVLSPFSLTDQDGQPYGLDNLKGRWTFVSIGFTACGDICPTNMATYRAIEQALTGQPVDFLFISVDPERDSQEQLAEYVRGFNPRFLGATGSHDALQALTRDLGLMYARPPEQEQGTGMYMVDHSATILLLDPQARLAAVFTWPHDSAAMAADFGLLSDYYQASL